jgi:hypothetical protein
MQLLRTSSAPEINKRMRPHLKMSGTSYWLDSPDGSTLLVRRRGLTLLRGELLSTGGTGL